jgi:hypothetical protein
MTLEERKQQFHQLAWMQLGSELTQDFIDYWTEHSINGKKMRFEKEKVFDIKRRFATWKRNSLKWDKKEPTFMDKIINLQNQINGSSETNKFIG